MDTQQLLHSIPEPKRLWFKNKRYGWGWRPSTWEGWVILFMYVAAVAANIIFLHLLSPISRTALLLFLMHLATLTTLLIVVCYARGESPKWQWGGKKELILDVLDASGASTGKTATRTKVHEQGLWHRAAHVYIINSKNEILLQRRSAQNSLRAGRWYLSTGAHVPAGSTALQTAKKYTESELGLRLEDKDFAFVGSIAKGNVLLYGTYINNEFDDIYLVHCDIVDPKLTKHTGERGDLEWFPVVQFIEYTKGNDPSFVQYAGLPVLFEYIKKHPTKNA